MAKLRREGSGAVTSKGPESSAAGNVQTDDGQGDADHDEREEAAGARSRPGGLSVDFGNGIGRGEEGVVVVDGEEDGDEIAETGDEADGDLKTQGDGDVALGVGDLLGQVGDGVDGADAEGAVEHAGEEDEAVGVANVGGPLGPDKVGRGVTGAAVAAGHDGDGDDGDDEEAEDGEDAKLVDGGHGAVGEADGGARDPGGQDVDDEDVPGLGLEPGVVERVHLHNGVAEDGRHAGRAEDPGEVVPPAGEEANDAAPSAPGSHRRPVVHAGRRRDGAGQLGDAGRHVPVAHGHGDELVQHAGGPAVEDGHEDGPANGRPHVADHETDAREREEVEVLVKLLDVTRGVDEHVLVGGCLGLVVVSRRLEVDRLGHRRSSFFLHDE